MQQLLAFVRQNHRAVLATTRSDGGVQLSPVAVAVLSGGGGGIDGLDGSEQLVVSSRETAMKTLNLKKRPYASLCIFTDHFYGEWHQAEGAFDVVSLPDAMDGLVDYYRSVSGDHPDWDDYRRAMQEERRVLLRMTIERVGPKKAG